MGQIDLIWKLDGLIVGEPYTSFPIDTDESTPKPTLLHPIRLSSTQCQELLDYLEANQQELSKLYEQEEKDRQELLARVYRLILQ